VARICQSVAARLDAGAGAAGAWSGCSARQQARAEQAALSTEQHAHVGMLAEPETGMAAKRRIGARSSAAKTRIASDFRAEPNIPIQTRVNYRPFPRRCHVISGESVGPPAPPDSGLPATSEPAPSPAALSIPFLPGPQDGPSTGPLPPGPSGRRMARC